MPKRTAAKPGQTPSKSAAEARRIMTKLAAQHPNADTELHYTDAYELLVATILSAQCTDERVNQVTPALFRRYPSAGALAAATTDALEPQIQPTGFFRAKSRALIGMAKAVVERHGGEIPNRMEDLVDLPGVGRKTANVVLGHALGVPGLPVDRHVLRVANRIGIARSENPEVVEAQLCAAMPSAKWTNTSDVLILHGRRICKPKPLCDRCAVRAECDYFRSLGPQAPRRGTVPSPRRTASRRGSSADAGNRSEATPPDTPRRGGKAERDRDAAASESLGGSRRTAKPEGTGRGTKSSRPNKT